MTLISADYTRLNSELHERNAAYGTSGSLYAEDILSLYSALGALSILDYGAGKGTLKKSLPEEIDVREYDPAIENIALRPGAADLVTCTDVLEHIEPECLAEVLEDINSLAVKGVFLSIACRPAKKFLDDGRNAHLIVEKPMWWMSKLSACFSNATAGGIRFGDKSLIAWVRK